MLVKYMKKKSRRFRHESLNETFMEKKYVEIYENIAIYEDLCL